MKYDIKQEYAVVTYLTLGVQDGILTIPQLPMRSIKVKYNEEENMLDLVNWKEEYRQV